MTRALLMSAICWLGAIAWAWSAEPSLLWVEGENPARSEVHHNSWYDAVDPQELSGGGQIANFSEADQSSGWAEYEVTVARAGNYRFWLRANPCTGIQYQIDGSDRVPLDPKALEEEDRRNQRKPGYVRRVQQWFNVAADGTHDARTMTWYDLGQLELSEGKHVLRFSLGGEAPNTKRFAAVDCFVLTTAPFAPNFQYKPGERPQDLVSFAAGRTWDFTPQRDEFSPQAMLDLRNLNEDYAGQHGFIRLSGDGNSFVRGDGQPIRFWGGSDYVQRIAHERNDQTVLERHARFLAKRGVNVVRLHGAIQPKRRGAKLTDVDERELDEIYRLVAAMKKAGIYTIISPYWAVQAHAQKAWGVADAENGNCAALLFFDPMLQKGYKAWLKRIYADVNPYTGIPLAKDPAVAIIQIQNEDSMLFWTMQSVKGQALKNLRKLYGQWVLKKYGSFDKARAAWQNYRHDEDDYAAGMPGMFIVWELTEDARNKKGNAPGREARLADQTEFMGRTMYNFNQDIARYLRDQLGCRQLINAGNWRTADQVILDDVERWSYTAGEVIGKNHYFAGVHNGLNVGWQILPGQVFTSRLFAKDPYGSPLSLRHVVGHPFIVPESLWVPPTRYEAEGPLIVAAQSCLSGLDTFYWFATGAEQWQDPGSKWTFSVPMTLGQFPAAALVFRKGYVDQGPVVVHEERSLDDLWHRRLPLIAEEGAWDPNRDQGAMPQGTPYQAAVDPLAYLVGRVEVKYGGQPSRSTVIDLHRYIDKQKQVVRSVTGQITTDLARGLYLVDAPKVQAAAGLLGGAGPQNLSDVTIACDNQYASIVVVSLDDKPIAASGRLLVQVGTVCRPTGWKERPMQIPSGKGTIGASRIIEAGRSPWQIEKAHGEVTIRNASLTKATLLDSNGLPTSALPITRDRGRVRLPLPEGALYAVVEQDN
jgi:hypothetical protein